ncbi:MAG: beta-galactosidase [Clostridia bacterium]|nr:beta-galactosidase [Clostridia bacterium]
MFRMEHPNPQFFRDEWINLNGEWDFEFDFGNSGKDAGWIEKDGFEKKITVPFYPESDLSGIGYKDFINCVWYKKRIDIPENWKKSGRVIIHFGAVDYKTTLYVNKKSVGTHEGGYSSFKFDITDFLSDSENIITVCAEDDLRSGLQPAGKQSDKFNSYGCFYTRTTGIWQTVWLEHTPDEYVKSFKFFPDAENVKIGFEIQVCGRGDVTVSTSYEGTPTGDSVICANNGIVRGEISLSEKHLWELGAGRLYDVELRFGDDVVKTYFGLRDVKLEGMKFMLNGKTVFQRTVLDQGFYPDGIYTAPDDETLKRDIILSMDMGFNGARLHEKMFEARFLYYCDKLGYMVWGEHANWGLDHSKPEALAPMLNEWLESLDRDFNHPSIIGWCPFNETWDVKGNRQRNEVISTVYKTTKAMDPTRPCIDTSGNFHVETDIFDFHDYEQNVEKFKEYLDKIESEGIVFDQVYRSTPDRQTWRGEAIFCSEYGGIYWDEDNTNEGWGYGEAPVSKDDLIKRYKGLTDILLDNKNIMGFCYTQLYDVEQEKNGLYTYERKPKFDMEIFKKINTQKAKIED